MATVALPAFGMSSVAGCAPRAASTAVKGVSSGTRVTPSDVLGFWFEGDATKLRKKWFMGGAETDAELKRVFGAAVEAAKRGELDSWMEHPRSLLALILLVDQFGRSIHRGSAEAFAGDTVGLRAALVMAANGWDKDLGPLERMFAYLPLEHSEDPAMMRLSLRKFEDLGNKQALDFAVVHADILKRFGRYPHRNAVLGRENTPEEEEYLKSADSFGQ